MNSTSNNKKENRDKGKEDLIKRLLEIQKEEKEEEHQQKRKTHLKKCFKFNLTCSSDNLTIKKILNSTSTK
jgi:hypothetical protein